jgi:hypothetical protein
MMRDGPREIKRRRAIGELRSQAMQERVKVFTFISGTGATVIETTLEDRINEWLARTGGKLLSVSQSESTRPGTGHHITVSLWYTGEEEAGSAPG